MTNNFDPGALIDAAQTGLIPSCTISLPKDDFVALISWLTIYRFREGHPTTKGAADYGMEPSLGLLTLHGPNGPVVVKADEPLVDLVTKEDTPAAEDARRLLRWHWQKVQEAMGQIARYEAATLCVWKKPSESKIKAEDLAGANHLIEADSGPIEAISPDPFGAIEEVNQAEKSITFASVPQEPFRGEKVELYTIDECPTPSLVELLERYEAPKEHPPVAKPVGGIEGHMWYAAADTLHRAQDPEPVAADDVPCERVPCPYAVLVGRDGEELMRFDDRAAYEAHVGSHAFVALGDVRFFGEDAEAMRACHELRRHQLQREADQFKVPVNVDGEKVEATLDEILAAHQTTPEERQRDHDKGPNRLYRSKFDEPSASVTKRKIDERPVEPPCDCGGAAAGTPHAPWCSTRRRK